MLTLYMTIYYLQEKYKGSRGTLVSVYTKHVLNLCSLVICECFRLYFQTRRGEKAQQISESHNVRGKRRLRCDTFSLSDMTEVC